MDSIEINNEALDTLLRFVFTSTAVKNDHCPPFPNNLKFIFKSEDIDMFKKEIYSKLYRKSDDCCYIQDALIYVEDIEPRLDILKRNLVDYLNNKDDNIYYIYIDDTSRFANLLYKLTKTLYNEDSYHFKIGKVLDWVWLRMSPSEFDNIYNFLERQIAFAENKSFPYDNWHEKYLCSFKEFDIYYTCLWNHTCYETNKNMSLTLCINGSCFLKLPQIHFQVLDEGSKKICYIYAIQNEKDIYISKDVAEEFNKKESSTETLRATKKELRNKYVNYRFILALKFFVELLRQNGIYDIRVPLLQMFNYDFHISCSNFYKPYIERFEKRIQQGEITPDYEIYVDTKKFYDSYAGKEDLISKNKTERLIGTFMTLEEKFGDIAILSEPFIQGENLLVKVLKPSNNKRH